MKILDFGLQFLTFNFKLLTSARMQKGFIRLTKKTMIMALIFILVFVGSGLYLLFLHPKRAEAAWFDDNWAYRTSYSINNSGSAVSYQKVKLDIDTATLITNGKIQSDCGDSRFTNEAGELLRYYLDSAGGACNTVSTDYYVLLPTIPANRSLIYHYYGNPAAQDGTEAAQFSEATFTPAAGPTAASEEKGTGPVGYWKFDEGYGTTANDSTLSNLDGALTGTTWQNEDLCVNSKCLYFDGTSDYATVTDNSLIDFAAADSFTISFWLRTGDTGTVTNLVTKYPGSNTYYTVELRSSGKAYFEITETGANFPNATSTTTVNDNRWRFITAVRDTTADRVYIYVDGVQEASAVDTTTGTLANTGNLTIGDLPSVASRQLTGFVDEIKIYRYARTQAQINADFAARGASKGQGTVLGAAAQNAKGALSDGLVGYWRMNESSGTSAADSSGNGYTGTDTSTTVGAAGKFSNARTFNGSTSVVSVADATPLRVQSAFTIAAWINPTSLTGYMQVISKFPWTTNFAWQVNTTDTGKLRTDVSTTGTTYSALASSTGLSTSTWQHVVSTWDGQTIRHYINGTQDSSTLSFSGTLFGAATTVDIGRVSGSNNQNFNGSIDDVRIYNRALTPREVEQLYNFAPGPVGYWNMDEKSGTTAFDQSTNANNGTLTNGPTWTQGRFGQALSFDGSNDYVSVADSTTLSPRTFTAEAWIKLNRTNVVQAVVQKETSFDFWVNASGNLLSDIYTTAWDGQKTGSSTLSTNTWYHVALTFDGTTRKMYLNGVEDQSSALSGNMNDSANAVQIGTLYNGSTFTNDPLSGQIDDVRIYNYARTAKQVIEDMLGGRSLLASGGSNAGPGSGQVAYWKLDEGYGTTANDNSTNTNNLTLSAASWTNSGRFGKAWDGTGARWLSRADDADFDFAAAEDLTVSLWLKSDSATNPAATEYLFNKGPTSAAGYSVYVNTSGQVCFGIDDDVTWGPDDSACSTTDYYDAAWHHIVATKTGTTRIDLYVDGYSIASDTSIAATATLANASTMYVGDLDGVDNTSDFNGDLDEIKVYRAALTSSEVKVEYNRGAGIVLGALGTSSTYQPQAANQEYCVPGDTTSCAAPVAEWKFDEKSGTSANDTSGNANTGTLTNGPTWTQGKFGAAVNLNSDGGSNDYVNVADADNLDVQTGDFTISGWFKSTGATGGYVVAKDNCGDNGGYNISIGTSGVVGFRIIGTTSVTISSSATTNNAWHHAVGVRSGSSMILYVDGVQAATGTTPSGMITTTYPLTIGTRRGFVTDPTNCGNTTMTGQIDQVRVLNYARTAAQIAYDYNRGAPVGWWKFDEGQTATANDSAVNANNQAVGNNGTITIGASGTQTSAGDINTASTAWDNGQTGKFNYSLNFDGTDDYVSVGDPSSGVLDFSTNSFSWSYWVKRARSGTTEVMIAKTNGDLETTGTGYQDAFLSTNTPRAWIGTGSSRYARIESNTTVADTNWHHLAFVFDRSSLTNSKVYLDGRDITSGVTSNILSTDSISNAIGFEIGNESDDQFFFNGQIDDVRIFNYAATAAQVRDLYNHGAVRFGPNTGTP